MYEQKVTLTNEIGLHARPASIFIRQAVKFPCDITVVKAGRSYNAKSIMSVLSMSASKGDELNIRADGEEEKEAVDSLIDLIENKLYDY
ncbi:MAG: HPr family phosphocarrier protein [Anaerococcus sp.]|uniref:HPr family phosphocarrier protein n=1 Tax=Anaerococcus sp. AGMB09787 TaxID=2922869 RepID=UPI001FAED90B|nr:HPr family phosphocarrier protein [Anaerococcus sp. AGMB09787]MCI7238755.1 HPr family phosphocarrier protein [Anaerococcus sp.]MDD7044632.1 HPr family phosphocarrier protein [Peptoniphilaceae bacterium]MDY2919217.1 HPr family phosphocarrier protein [Anaerococcus sp.]